jgi:hypothetical protein
MGETGTYHVLDVEGVIAMHTAAPAADQRGGRVPLKAWMLAQPSIGSQSGLPLVAAR